VSALRSRPALVVLFALGVGLMIPFEEWYTRLAGMTCLIGFIVLGVFLIAEPGFLSGDEQAPEDDPA
jgi:hypothetical protein